MTKTTIIREIDRYLRHATIAIDISRAHPSDSFGLSQYRAARLKKSLTGMDKAFFALRDLARDLEKERCALRRSLRKVSP